MHHTYDKMDEEDEQSFSPPALPHRLLCDGDERGGGVQTDVEEDDMMHQ